MAVKRLNVVATGCSSGLGFATLERLVSAPSPSTSYRFLVGCRDPSAFQLKATGHTLDLLKLDLSSFDSVTAFAEQVKAKLAGEKVDVILLCAAVVESELRIGQGGWCSEAIVNHFCKSSPMWLGTRVTPAIQHSTYCSICSHPSSRFPRMASIALGSSSYPQSYIRGPHLWVRVTDLTRSKVFDENRVQTM